MADTCELRRESLTRWRLAFLIVGIAGWLLWQVCLVVAESGIAGGVSGPVMLAGNVLLLAWIGCLIGQMIVARRVKADRALRSALFDELSRANNRRAFRDGYWAMLIVVAILIAVTAFVRLPAMQMLQIVLMVAVVTPVARYVWFELGHVSPGQG